jgi:hypothetical protein
LIYLPVLLVQQGFALVINCVIYITIFMVLMQAYQQLGPDLLTDEMEEKAVNALDVVYALM